ncbi:pilus biosynthesis protein [Escherichia coli O3:H9]
MKTKLGYSILAAAIFYSLPGMASPSSSEGGAFTVNMPKVSTVDDTKGCPSLETPLRLNFTENINRVYDSFSMDAWRGSAHYDYINDIWNVLPGNLSIAPTEHEIHIYVEYFKTTLNRFSDNNGVFAYTDDSGVMQANGEYKWEHVPELGQYVYKAVIKPWNKSQTKSIYLPGRDFKQVEVFHFQNNRPHWNDRGDYKKVKERVSLMNKSYPYSVVSKRDTTLSLNDKMDDDSESLFLYQKLTRSNVKDSKINYYQLRGLFTPGAQGAELVRNFIIFGGENADHFRGFGTDYKRFPVKDSYSMEDQGSFDKALKIQSIDLKIMEAGRVKNGTNMTQIASYKRNDFNMTVENLKACGLD